MHFILVRFPEKQILGQGLRCKIVPYRSSWLNGIGIAFFLLNIILFTFNCVMITLRFRWNPGSFKASFTDQSESLFIGTCVSLIYSFVNNQRQTNLAVNRLSRKSAHGVVLPNLV